MDNGFFTRDIISIDEEHGNEKIVIIVETKNKEGIADNKKIVKATVFEYGSEGFFETYGYFLQDFEKFNGDFLEYLQSKIEEPYLNNTLKETDFEYLPSKKAVKYEEGEWKVWALMEIGKFKVYANGSYMWIEDKEKRRKYFYYAD